ncbi:MspA family porin [Gordonia pseudamarae]|jgi:hypothetical protein|uniref:MspA protein n=1 Tax=Gordonia pseudamarae TaxID=2831662 RepID=A0ABX6IKP5_9ACTN|nr:MspA family porin [Gordonia pseudamarae]QHN36424.1 hypothetical protein GII31_17580 [Gordonia pseudamarae]
MSKTITRRVVAGVSLAAVSAFGLSALGAGGAVAGKVPGTTATKKLVDGTPVKIDLFDQNVRYKNTIVESFNLTREVWVSGKVRVTVGGKAEGGSIAAGYIIGCQVAIGIDSTADVSGDVSGTLAPSSNGATLTTGGGIDTPGDSGVPPTASANLSLGPGQAGYVPIIQEADDDDDAVNSFRFKGKKGGAAFKDESFKVTGCGGFAEGKAKVKVTVNTEAVKGVVSIYGKPFSLG